MAFLYGSKIIGHAVSSLQNFIKEKINKQRRYCQVINDSLKKYKTKCFRINFELQNRKKKGDQNIFLKKNEGRFKKMQFITYDVLVRHKFHQEVNDKEMLQIVLNNLNYKSKQMLQITLNNLKRF